MRHKQVAQGVTALRRSPKEDRDHRMHNYLIAMAIRTVSFPLAVWALVSGWLIIGLVLAAAATLLPQVAVMIANAVDQRTAPEGEVRSPIRALPEAGTPHTPQGPDVGL